MERRVHSKAGIAIIIVGSIFLLTAGAALAAGAAKSEPARLPAPTGGGNVATFVSSDTIRSTQKVTGTVMISTCITLFFGVEDVEQIAELRSAGFGWGEIAKAYFMAQGDEDALAYIIEMRQGEVGWREIFQDLVDLEYLPPESSWSGNHGRNLGCLVSGRCAPPDTVPKAAQRLADRLGADADAVAIATMLEEGASYGTIIVAHKLAAQFPEKTPEELVQWRLGEEGDKGDSWGQIRRELKASASTTASGLSTPGDGKAHGNGKDGNQGQGNQGHGKPDDNGNQGGGRGHDKDKDHGGGGGKKN